MTRTRTAALTSVVALVLVGAVTPAVSADGSARSRSLTFYEISDGIIVTDETPTRITLTPGAPPSVTPLTNPVQGASGVGDEIIIDSALYRDVEGIQVPELPPFLPVAADRDAIPVPWASFVPAGPEVGEALGVCTFVRVDLTLPPGPPNQGAVTDERKASCELTFRIPGGDVVVGGILDVSALEAGEPATLAITGGTERFQRVRGTVTLQQPSVPAFDRFVVTVDYRS